MAKLESKRHIYDVIKVNVFGVKQQRILVVTEPDGGKAGSLQICNNAGKVKRDLSLSDIKGVEEASGIKDAEDAERAVSFRFAGSAKQAAADKSEDRTLVFVSKKQRDAFLEVMDRISPGSVVRKSDGSLGSSDKPGSGKGGKGGKGSGSSGGLDLESLGSGAKFFAMEENDWGYAEPRLLLFNDGGTDLRVIDAAFAGGPAAAVAAAVEYPLRRVVRVSLHLGDKSILQLAFSDGGLLATVAKTVVLTFGDRGNRERFLDTLREKLDRQLVKYEVDDTWRGALPTKQFVRFEAHKLKPKKLQCVLLVSPRKRQVYVIRAKEIPSYEPRRAIPNGAPVEEILRVAPFRLQLERSPRSPKVLGIGDAGPQIAVTARETTEFEFLDGAERERFAALLAAMACPDPNLNLAPPPPVLSRSMSTLSIPGGGALSRGMSSASLTGPASGSLPPPPPPSADSPLSPGGSSSPTAAVIELDPMKRSPPGTVRSTFRAPSVADASPLWGASWPHDDVKIWVGTYNISQAHPPSDPLEMDKWVPAPTRDPAGPRDLYVFGLQELGSQTNRDAWGAALAKHLQPPPRDGPLTAAGIAGAGDGDGKKKDGEKEKSSGGFFKLLPGEKAKPAVDAAAELAASLGTTASKLSAAETERAYVLVDAAHMWEMGIWVFVRVPHAADVTSVVHADLPTGLSIAKSVTGVQLGNKGGVGVGFRWRETSLAFVMCHLPARPDAARLRKREADYRALVRKLKLETSFLTGQAGLDWVHGHDHVFFFGDANYRVELPFERAVELVNGKQFGAIMAHDQMVKEMGKGRAFVGFYEGRVEFAPTYRWLRDKPEFSWKRGQTPSFTDRVLHRSLPGVAGHVSLHEYASGTSLFGSDHRPVAASYSVGVRRYYSSPAPPLAYCPYPVPTFFAQVDAAVMPVPVLLLQGLKLSGVSALTAPAGVYLKIWAPWSDGAPIICSTMSAQGLTAASREALRALKGELAEEAKKAAKAEKERAKEAKAKAKEASKQREKDKAAGKTVSGDATAGASGSSADGKGKPGADDEDGPDSDDDGDDDGEGGGGGFIDPGAAGEYAILDEDAVHAAAAVSNMLDAESSGRSIDPKRKALLTMQVEYSWTPSETAIPPLRPAVWDPRLLRTSHIFVVAHAAPGPDGTMLAIGDSGKAKSGGGKGADAVVGQAVIPVGPFVRAAGNALEIALAIQGDDNDDEIAALLGAHKAEAAAAAAGPSDDTAGIKAASSAAGKKPSPLPPQPSLMEQEAAAVSPGIIECPPEQYAKAFNPDGVPWALTAPPVGWRCDCEAGGQVMGKLSGSGALRASIDPLVARRGQGAGAHVTPTWDFPLALAALQSSWSLSQQLASLAAPGGRGQLPPPPPMSSVLRSPERMLSSGSLPLPPPPVIVEETGGEEEGPGQYTTALPPPPPPLGSPLPPPPGSLPPPPSSGGIPTPATARGGIPSPAGIPVPAGGAAASSAPPPPLSAGVLVGIPSAASAGVAAPGGKKKAANPFFGGGGADSTPTAAGTGGDAGGFSASPGGGALPPAPAVPSAGSSIAASARLISATKGGPPGAPTGGTAADVIRGKGATAIAPEFQAFFEAQFAKQLKISETPDAPPAAEAAPGAGAAGGGIRPPGPKPGAAAAAGDESDDDDDEEEGDGGAGLAAALETIRAAQAKVLSRADKITDAIAAAKERAEALTSKTVAAYWSPEGANAAIQANLRKALGSSLLHMQASGGGMAKATTGVSFVGVRNVLQGNLGGSGGSGSAHAGPGGLERGASTASLGRVSVGGDASDALSPRSVGGDTGVGSSTGPTTVISVPGGKTIALPPKPGAAAAGGPVGEPVVAAAAAGIKPPPKPSAAGAGAPGGVVSASAAGVVPPPKPRK